MDPGCLSLRYGFYADHRIINLGMAARGLYVSLLTWTTHHRKDYTIPPNIPLSLCRASNDDCDLLIDQLLEAGLLVLLVQEGSDYRLSDTDLFFNAVETPQPVVHQQQPATRRQREIGLGPPVQQVSRVNKPAPPPSNFDHQTHFEELFAVWPSSARENKDFGLKAYRDMVHSQEDHDRIMNGVRGFLEERKTWSKEWQKKTGFLANFLLAEKWEKYASKPAVVLVPYVQPPETDVEREKREMIEEALRLRAEKEKNKEAQEKGGVQ